VNSTATLCWENCLRDYYAYDLLMQGTSGSVIKLCPDASGSKQETNRRNLCTMERHLGLDWKAKWDTCLLYHC